MASYRINHLEASLPKWTVKSTTMSNQKCGLFQVTPYHFSINDVEITVFDTPGLADGTGNEAEYLAKIKGKVTDFDVFIFCTEMNSQRFRNDDINTVEKLTEAFGSKLWEYAVVVLTFANEVYPPPSKKGVSVQEFFDHRMRCFKKKIRDVILNAGVADEVMITLPFVAAGDLGEPRLPGINNWLTAFWIATFKRLNRSARSTFLLASINRFNYVSTSELNVPRRAHSWRRSLPARESVEDNHLRRQVQRRSFQGFELVDREHVNTHIADNGDEEDHRHFKSLSMPRPATKSKSPPKTKPKPTRIGERQDAPAIAVDEPSVKEIVIEITSEVGKEGSKLLGDWIHPGSGRMFGAVFSWIMKLLKGWLLNDSAKENCHVEEYECEVVEEDTSRIGGGDLGSADDPSE